MSSTDVIVIVGTATTVLGTIGGALEKLCAPGSIWYKVGVVFASLGVDLASLSKLGGGK
jgi:hypothetical protein